MNTIRTSVWEKKLPLSGLILVIALLATIGVLTSNAVLVGTKAAVGATPKKVQVTNVSDTSFTVSYLTDDPQLGSLTYGKDSSLGSTMLDDRDQPINNPAKHRLHYITIKNLTPGTKYNYAITSGGDTFKDNDNFFEVTTAPVITASASAQAPLKGKVTLDDGTIPVEGIVSVSADNSQTVSALLRQDGSYEVPLNTVRTQDLSANTSYSEDTLLHITIADPQHQSVAEVTAKEAGNVPMMTLSKNYDFSASSTDTEASASAAITPVTLPSTDSAPVTAPEITTPKTDQSFSNLQPTFDGKAVAGSTVDITIQSQDEITATVTADTNGNWQYTPQNALSAGKHTIIIKSPDAQGLLKTISQSFTVFAEGSQFVEPSISPPPLPTPVLAPPTPASASPTLEEPTPSPTPTIEPTPTPTIAVTPAPQPSGNPGNSGGGVTPNTGNESWLFGVAGLIFAAGAGALLFFFI
jgi:hypothetical protein